MDRRALRPRRRRRPCQRGRSFWCAKTWMSLASADSMDKDRFSKVHSGLLLFMRHSDKNYRLPFACHPERRATGACDWSASRRTARMLAAEMATHAFARRAWREGFRQQLRRKDYRG